jgi:hypothetical protein
MANIKMLTNDFLWWTQFREETKWYLTNSEYRMVCEIHARLFEHPVNYPCKCEPTVIQLYIDEINAEFIKL